MVIHPTGASKAFIPQPLLLKVCQHHPSRSSNASPSPIGKFAIVYRAQRKSDEELVALKKINIDVMDKKNREKTLKEVRLIQVRAEGSGAGVGGVEA